MFTALAAGCANFSLSGCDSITAVINMAINSFFTLVWVVAVIYLAYGGLLFITSAGDKGKATTAKDALTNALIGICVILGIQLIINLGKNLFGVGDSVTITKPTINAPTIN
jgi:threonine/homoserine/homoserine lactone efflux protein